MKALKILLINSLILVFLLFSIEWLAYAQIHNQHKDSFSLRKGHVGSIKEDRYFAISSFSMKGLSFRPVCAKHLKKRPIILFGCSYTYGVFLENNQTFSYKLSNYTNRTVYNRGVAGTGLPFMYYQLKETDIKKDIPDTEYIIYTFINDHLNRLYKYRSWTQAENTNIVYKLEENKLVESKPVSTLYMETYISRVIEEEFANIQVKNKKYDKLFYALMDESMKLAKEKYPGVKFVFLVYDSASKKLINRLKDKGFIVIYVSELLNSRNEIKKEKYFVFDKCHPSEEAWDLLVPKLAAKLNL